MSVKDKTTEKRGGKVESEGDDDSDDEVGDSEGDGDNALKQNVSRIKKSKRSNFRDNWTPSPT